MKKAFFIALLLLLIGVGSLFGTWVGSTKDLPAQQPQVNGANIARQQKETVTKPGIPIRLSIPAITVEATVESVGMDNQGRMDVPKNADNVAWYNLGYRPGARGSAVLAGHFDKASGAPAIFYKIKELQIGDKITITDDKGKEHIFAVVRVTDYPYNRLPLQEVFGQNKKPMLNLITCEGKWNTTTKNYSHRTVVYSEMVQ